MSAKIRLSAIATTAFTLASGGTTAALAQINPGMLFGAQQAQQAQAQQQQQNAAGGAAAGGSANSGEASGGAGAAPPAAPPPPAAPAAPAPAPAGAAAGAAAPAATGADASGGAAGDTADGAQKKDSDDDSDKDDAEKQKAAKEQAEREKLLKEGYNPIKAAMFDINTGKPRDAIEKLKPLLEKKPKDIQAHYVLAIGYVQARQYEEAAAEYRAVLKLAPPTSRAYLLATEGLKKIQK